MSVAFNRETDGSRTIPKYVVEQRDYYRRASNKAHYGYLASQTTALSAAALVPVAAATTAPKWIAAALGAAAALGTGLGLIFRFKDNFASRSITLEKIRAAIGRYLIEIQMSEQNLLDEVSE